jgi:hypothetical protein
VGHLRGVRQRFLSYAFSSLLARPGPSDSTGPSRTLSGLLPAATRVPRAATALSFTRQLRLPGGGVPSPPLDSVAPRGARQVVPDQDDRRAELLAGGVQQPGAARLGEPLALVAGPAADVDAVDQPGPLSGFTAISAASDTFLLLPPVTAPTGVLPRRPQVRPRVA